MKKFVVLAACVLFVLFFCIALGSGPTLRAEGELTTTVTTEEAVTTATEPVVNSENDIAIDITEDSVIISGLPDGAPDIVLSKDQAIDFLAAIIESNFGPVLTTLGISAGALAVFIIGLLCVALNYLVKHVKNQRESLAVSKAKASSDDGMVTALKDLATRTLRAEKRAAKGEAYSALAAKGTLAFLANSSNEQNALTGTTYQKELEEINKLGDEVSEEEINAAVTKLLKDTAVQVKNVVVGAAVKTIKAKKSALVAALTADGK